MLNAIIRFSIKNKFIIGLFTCALIIWGMWSASKLPIDAVPDITNNQVQIITICPTLAAQEVEQFVTYPIEQGVANLPDVVELRSISRFGLSVVTVVFDDAVDIWFARQLVGEKIREAQDEIPPGMGSPELAPVSTGLGEIYQYVIHPKKGSEDKYNAMELRTMQDWIVARQLYGTPGVAEVNSFGGILKQYEVSVSPDRLRAMNITIAEIFKTLENNNENTGGAYIDKKPNAYFIRGIGLINSMEDIRKTVIKRSPNGIPILIGDVAEVQLGSAMRYGAVTWKGEKEAVGGIVMMLKGSNSAEVVKTVKEKMVIIQKSLPEDVVIEPFLDRTDLVDRAISTVEKNLVEGALIVIFVLVVFLGNLRAGLIVASAIPLSMLFALGMMHVFGVSANLMSLGAIDFGLIVDGAVIIVEATMHALGLQKSSFNNIRLTQSQMDDVVEGSAKKMMNSAAFGQIIILIVYIPILSLVGIEGKMFRPMAQTVSFAILGALLLSITYIPMMSSLVLPKQQGHKRNISDGLMDFFHRLYQPLLDWAMRLKFIVVSVTILLFAMSLLLFSRLGGEFIPQLQEGDFAFHCILPMGSSLSQSIETSMQAERLISEFPEVKMVVGKTGSAEVPTDPMPPEVTDLVIILKPKSEWVTTQDYNELASLMEEKLHSIPGIFFETNQPIQMRFNELMTGIRQDVAIKIFGENIDTLASMAPTIANAIQSIEGLSSPQVERTIGLPQISIEYDRNRLAHNGVSIEEVNHTVSTAFAGEKAGVVFENERRFDLVVRLDSTHRSSFEDVSELLVPTPSGNQIPLSQLANVVFRQGPAQISRDDGKRRIVIGFNVQGRDVQSVVKEIRTKLDQQIKLPSGYYYTFGGTFENLEKANARLRVAVPMALILIFILLYFTFRSLKPALLIYSAIPMSAIGGVIALYLRDMPFSISAGVGFIALFGVAVLNGIVLVATFIQLRKEGIVNVVDQVKEGARIRLRPVLMTATVASLGFLPMAISTGAGAEVQKPLATVVIGGLISATFLTLVVLPLLYIIFNHPKKKMNTGNPGYMVIIMLIIILAVSHSDAQTINRISPDQAVQKAFESNFQIQLDQLQNEQAHILTRSWFDFPKTGLFIENEDFSPVDKDGIWKIGLSQRFQAFGINRAQKEVLQNQLELIETKPAITRSSLRREVYATYYQLWYIDQKLQLFQKLDSLYSQLAEATILRVRTGEAPGLERIAAEAKVQEIRMQTAQLQQEISIEQQTLKKAMNVDEMVLPLEEPLTRLHPIDSAGMVSNHPLLMQQAKQLELAGSNINFIRKVNNPEISVRAFSQRLYGIPDPVSGFSFNLEVPLLGNTNKSRLEAAQVEQLVQEKILQMESQQLSVAATQALEQVNKANEALTYYESIGLSHAQEIIETANQGYRAGDISFADLSQFITLAVNIRKNYLEALNEYNQAVIRYSYFVNP